MSYKTYQTHCSKRSDHNEHEVRISLISSNLLTTYELSPIVLLLIKNIFLSLNQGGKCPPATLYRRL